jgi:hypothetical protein
MLSTFQKQELRPEVSCFLMTCWAMPSLCKCVKLEESYRSKNAIRYNPCLFKTARKISKGVCCFGATPA